MKPSTSLLSAFAALAHVSSANFDIYTNTAATFVGGVAETGWKVFEAEPDCSQVNNAPQLQFDCTGDCFGGQDASGIERITMTFSTDPLYSWTISRDDGYRMIGQDGNSYGECIVFPGDDFYCATAVNTDQGTRKLRCLTEFTASQLNEAALSGS
ncbi:hypothetical protein N0V95_001517 [Ascochyta clinopodiicola]|nr:hypothetical protein N0V95_001517 [Ascochyta clinopodiicola]